MKALIQMLIPTLKAFIGVVVFLFSVVSISYTGIVLIAKTEAKSIEDKIMAVRKTDVEHFDKRFNKIDEKLDKIQSLIKESR